MAPAVNSGFSFSGLFKSKEKELNPRDEARELKRA